MPFTHEIQKRIGLIVLIILAIILGYWYVFMRSIESTDNAYLKGNLTVLSPRVGGYIQTVTIKDNEYIKAGTVVAKIDDTDYKARVEQALSQLAALDARHKSLTSQQAAQLASIQEAEAGIKSAKANSDRADKELNRSHTLIKDGAISRQVNDVAIADQKGAAAVVERAKANLEAAKNQLLSISAQIEEVLAQRKSAEAALTLAKFDLENTEIKINKDGTIGNRTMQQGQLARPGSALAYFIPDGEIWIEANFKESQIARMRAGQPVKILIDAYSGQTFHGTVDSLSPASGSEFSILPPENATGNFTKIVRRVSVKIIFNDGTDLSSLKPGLSAYVSVNTR